MTTKVGVIYIRHYCHNKKRVKQKRVFVFETKPCRLSLLIAILFTKYPLTNVYIIIKGVATKSKYKIDITLHYKQTLLTN